MSEQETSLWWRFVHFAFRLLYHEMAFSYDTVSWLVSLGEWRCWQRSVLNYLPPPETGLVLEIAHGTGNLQLDLAAASYQSFAYDFSPQMGKIAQAKLNRQQITGQFTRGKAQELPFADKTFAALLSTFPTNFITQPETLREAYRVLQPEGRFIVVLNGSLTGGGLVTRFIEWLYTITGQRDERLLSLAEIFGGYGFAVEAEEVPCKHSRAQVLILKK